MRIKFRRSEDVWGSAATEAEADSDRHLVPQGTPHPCFSSFEVSLQTYNVNYPKEIKQINIRNCVVDVSVKGIDKCFQEWRPELGVGVSNDEAAWRGRETE